MNVSLTPELEQVVQRKVAKGMYSSASEVVRAGLRMLLEHERLQEAKLKALKRDLARGLQEADRGELIDGGEVFSQLRRRNASQAARRK